MNLYKWYMAIMLARLMETRVWSTTIDVMQCIAAYELTVLWRTLIGTGCNWRYTNLEASCSIVAYILLTPRRIQTSCDSNLVWNHKVVACSMERFMHTDYGSWFICIYVQAVSWRFLFNPRSKILQNATFCSQDWSEIFMKRTACKQMQIN